MNKLSKFVIGALLAIVIVAPYASLFSDVEAVRGSYSEFDGCLVQDQQVVHHLVGITAKGSVVIPAVSFDTYDIRMACAYPGGPDGGTMLYFSVKGKPWWWTWHDDLLIGRKMWVETIDVDVSFLGRKMETDLVVVDMNWSRMKEDNK